jgi:hypothetical protein
LGVGKGLIVRIVAMLTRMIDRGHGGVREEGIVYENVNVNVNENENVNVNVNVNDEDTGQPDGWGERPVATLCGRPALYRWPKKRTRSQRSGTRTRTRDLHAA